ncbi:MAG: LPS export ABC transporter periplasmic protein LptC [Legionellales bacterium]|nr:LPS export ABC transporter periplasmic protein LptC [Legionellales bacterium]|tara:strand:+ start:1975 stop:2550 length:576 start_codon:yes stop_codon:yes gene_type:complete
MFSERWKLISILLVIAGFSYWTLDTLTEGDATKLNELAHYPDYYLENFTTLTMNEDGTPKNRLRAVYMSHYQDDNTSELHKPELEIFRVDRPSIMITADSGWVTSNNDVILLSGNVYLHQDDELGNLKVELIAEDARVLVDEKYAETDKAATFITKRTVTNSIGMRIYFQEQRMEFLSNVQTTVEPKQASQ